MNVTNDPVQLGREVSRVASELYGHSAADRELSPEGCHTLGDALGVIAHALIRPSRTRRTAMTTDLDLAVSKINKVYDALEHVIADHLLTDLLVASGKITNYQGPRPTPTEPEIVSGAEAQRLREGSQIVRVDPDDHAKVASGAAVVTLGRGLPQRGSSYRVLYRAPEPATPTYVFRVGQVVRLKAEVDALPVGTVVRTPEGRTAERDRYTWQSSTFHLIRGNSVNEKELFGAQIIFLPDENA